MANRDPEIVDFVQLPHDAPEVTNIKFDRAEMWYKLADTSRNPSDQLTKTRIGISLEEEARYRSARYDNGGLTESQRQEVIILNAEIMAKRLEGLLALD